MKLCSALAIVCLASCSGHHSSVAQDGAPGDAALLDAARPDAPPLDAPPPLTSTVGDCSADTHPCVQTDFSQVDHTISPLLFGDGIEWTQYGENVLAPGATPQDPGTPRPDVISALAGMRFTMMRYPGGTLADLFHWKQAIGDIASRVPQDTLSVDSSTSMLQTEVPYFGPDEFASFVGQIGSPAILLTVNVGTGTAQEAADWVSHWESNGVSVGWVEIGNEMYVAGPGNSFPKMTPSQYATAFDAYAAAIHAVDPTIKLGVLGISDTTFWCTPNCTSNPWNQVVLSSIQQKADWMSVHDFYAPTTDQISQAIYEATLSFPAFETTEDQFVEQDIDTWASAQNEGLPLGITEHSSYFTPTPGSTDFNQIITQTQRNQTWAAALFSALSYQVMLRDPRLLLANHINPLSYLFQAPIKLDVPDLKTYPAGYTPNPRVSSYGRVFQAYRALAGQGEVPASVVRSPTISTATVGNVPALKDTPLLDAVAAAGQTGPTKGWLFLVNRSLTTDLMVSFVLKNLPAGSKTLEVDELTAADYESKQTVDWTTVLDGTLPNSPSFGTTLAVPKQTLLRVRVR